MMDERDEEWLKEFNAKQEGSSSVKQEPYANGTSNGKDGGKSKKGKEKDKKDDKEGTGALKISEDVFEYVMGMLELWTEKNVPMLHTVCRFTHPIDNSTNPSFRIWLNYLLSTLSRPSSGTLRPPPSILPMKSLHACRHRTC